MNRAGGQHHLFTEAHGCECGSTFVGSSNDAREIRGLLEAWQKIHPKDRMFNGAFHAPTSVDRAKRLRQLRGQKIERNRVEVR